MKKIPTLFVRDVDLPRRVVTEITPGCEWVINGEGVATRKYDGTCCLVRDGKLFRRYEVKKGKQPPPNFEPATEVDPNTGKQQGWLPVGSGPEDKYHREAFAHPFEDGTYELVGPKIQGNPEHLAWHALIPHGRDRLDAPRDYSGLQQWLQTQDIEGVVWHHPDGRMAKIKAKDFGIKRGTSPDNSSTARPVIGKNAD